MTLALDHDVNSEVGDKGQVLLSASSPDEGALVQAAARSRSRSRSLCRCIVWCSVLRAQGKKTNPEVLLEIKISCAAAGRILPSMDLNFRLG